MNEIIKVNFETQTVSARDLYDEVNKGKERFSKWFARQLQFGFVENEDYTSVLKSTVVNNGASRDLQDYHLSIDMAKQICMVQKTEKARQIRQQLIDLEKAWNSPEQIMARALKMADKTIKSLEQKIEEQKPLVDFARHVTESSDTVDVGEFAKVVKKENIKIGRNRLFEWLRDKGYLMSNNTPYQKYIESGYFKVVEVTKNTAYGTNVYTKTLITGKGQVYFVEKLRKEFGIAA